MTTLADLKKLDVLRRLRKFHRRTCDCQLFTAHGCELRAVIDEIEDCLWLDEGDEDCGEDE